MLTLINQLLTSEWELKDWNHIKRKFQLTDDLYYKFTQISHTVQWKQTLKESRIETSAIYLDHHLIKNNLLLSLGKLISKELYWYLSHIHGEEKQRCMSSIIKMEAMNQLNWLFLCVLECVRVMWYDRVF